MKITSKKNVIHESLAKDWYANKIGKLFLTEDYFNEHKKIILKEYLSELLDPKNDDEYDIFKNSDHVSRKQMDIGGNLFEIECDISHWLKGFFRFSFKLVSSPHIVKPTLIGNDTKTFSKQLQDFEYGLTNAHNSIRVLKTLQSIMLTFILRNNPRGISFKDFDEGRRGKVYSYMAKKLCKATGYFLLEANHYFFLFKDKNDMLRVKAENEL